jgi:hypothetical protein
MPLKSLSMTSWSARGLEPVAPHAHAGTSQAIRLESFLPRSLTVQLRGAWMWTSLHAPTVTLAINAAAAPIQVVLLVC